MHISPLFLCDFISDKLIVQLAMDNEVLVNLCVCSPYEIYLNPLEVESITVEESIQLDANHCLVVYKQHDEHIERRIVTGPTVFIPGPQEWYVTLNVSYLLRYSYFMNSLRIVHHILCLLG